ncbi:MAG TPA: LuxR C-terminal-related transcriptional regulator [Candidatus Dormibacteraeota bacterium]|nr:LuxR C-terminal-related transcriptional regulator [Candidatus Dormibacteraeota bacterium]
MSGRRAGRWDRSYGRTARRHSGQRTLSGTHGGTRFFGVQYPRNSMSAGSPNETQARLSPREMEVARLVAEGLTNREIAAKLFLSERTVDGHLEHIREKLAVNTRAQVTAWVVRHDAAPAPAAPTTVPPAPRQRWVFAHPRAWMAAAVVLGLLAGTVGVLRLTAPPEPVIRTFAGDCPPESDPDACRAAGDLGPATKAVLSRPTSVAVDSTGIAYIADYANGRIRKVDQGGMITTLVGGGDKELADGVPGFDVSSQSLGLASTVAVDRQGAVYVLTSRNEHLEVWKDSNQLMKKVVDVGPSHELIYIFGPRPPVGGLAITAEDVIYIADRAGNRVWRFDGNQKTAYAGTGVDGALLGDQGNAIEAELSNPIGLALDSQENLYIADTGNDRIRKVDRVKKTITTVAGGPGGSLVLPYGVALAHDGTVLIADTGNYRIQELSTRGAVATVAGTGQWGFQGDGMPATQAEFDVPEGIALSAEGNLYIADTNNMRVRVISHLLGQ